jgi:hypothetical protein
MRLIEATKKLNLLRLISDKENDNDTYQGVGRAWGKAET